MVPRANTTFVFRINASSIVYIILVEFLPGIWSLAQFICFVDSEYKHCIVGCAGHRV